MLFRRHGKTQSLPILIAALLLMYAPADAESRVYFTTVREVVTRITNAHDVTLTAYTLSPRGIMARALLAAATHGARVHVLLDGHAFGTAQRMNLATGLELRKASARLEYTREPLHLKAALVDGTLYLSDRNWTSNAHAEVVLEDDALADRPIILRAVAGMPASNDHLWTRKGDALAAEARMLGGDASHAVCVETESFGAGTPVYDALLLRRERGDRVRLIVSTLEIRERNATTERAALARLTAAGVEVRVGNTGEKIAVDGDHGWLGSANATRGLPNQIDWGMTTPPEMTATLLQRFEANWEASQALGA